MSADQVARFEDRRWTDQRQVPVWRHGAAARLVREEPARLGKLGVWLADVRPALFASAVAVRARPATSGR